MTCPYDRITVLFILQFTYMELCVDGFWQQYEVLGWENSESGQQTDANGER